MSIRRIRGGTIPKETRKEEGEESEGGRGMEREGGRWREREGRWKN